MRNVAAMAAAGCARRTPGRLEGAGRGGNRALVEGWGRRLATSLGRVGSPIKKDGVYEAVVALLAIERLVPQHVRLSFRPRG